MKHLFARRMIVPVVRVLIPIAGLLLILPAMVLAGCNEDDPGPARVQTVYARFTAEPGTGFVSATNDMEVAFDAGGTNGTELVYKWDFGDGASGDGVQTVHSYTLPGRYVVILIIETRDGRLSDESKVEAFTEVAVGWREGFSGNTGIGDGARAHGFDVGPGCHGITVEMDYDEPRTGAADLSLHFPNGSDADQRDDYLQVSNEGSTIHVQINLPFQVVIRGGSLGEGIWSVEVAHTVKGSGSRHEGGPDHKRLPTALAYTGTIMVYY
jgi:PKD repeat protein